MKLLDPKMTLLQVKENNALEVCIVEELTFFERELIDYVCTTYNIARHNIAPDIGFIKSSELEDELGESSVRSTIDF